MELIIIIAIIFYVIKSKSKEQNKQGKNVQKQDQWQQIAMDTLMKEQNQAQQRAQAQKAQAQRAQAEAQRAQQEAKRAQAEAKRAQAEAQKALMQRAKEEAERAKAQKAYAQTQMKKTQVPNIVQRAKANVAENMADETLETMEREHDHSERVSPAIHHHPEDIIPENMLGTVEDLMVKGYDGNLCFERDFVGEAMDMINRFTA